MTPESISNIHKNINDGIYERNIPSKTLQPYYDRFSCNTKYVKMPIYASTINQHYQEFNPHKTFNPGSSAPWTGYKAAIDHESELRGQLYALQHSDQATYVPNSYSDLYQPQPIHNSKQTHNTHPLLSYQQPFSSHNPSPHPNIGSHLFNNNTRIQLKEEIKPSYHP